MSRVNYLDRVFPEYPDNTYVINQIAEGFSTSKAYKVGEYVNYQGDVYRFTSAKSAGVWDASKATAVYIADEVKVAPEQHRNVFRGKYLGTSYTAEQKAQVVAGTFDDLYVGDYWTINGVNWRIADIDYWYNVGDTQCTSHHLVIVPDSNLYSAQMNASDTTDGGYYGSAMRGGANGITSGNLANAVTTISSAFGSANILSKRLHMSNAVTNGYPSGGTWFDSTVDLMNEINVYGCPIFTPGTNGSTIPNLYTVDKTQFALFRLAPKFITNRGHWWLRDVVSAARFARVGYRGVADCYSASESLGVRPAFAIC